MSSWKQKLTACALSLTLIAAPVGMASAASAWQILLYGAAAMALAKQQLMKMDDGGKQQMLAETQKKTGVANEAYSERLEQIHRNLVSTGLVKRDYDVYVNPSTELNAFETIGGVISVNQGMMEALNDDELAFTLSHEMQHGENRHAVNGILKSIGISTLVNVAVGGNAELLDVLLGGLAINYIDNEVVTMDQEKEADAKGFDVFKNTNYNVGGAASSMEYVYEKHGELYQEGFKRVISPNNHPQMSSRIEKLAGRMSQWSGNHVQVGGDMVYVNALPVVRPAVSGAYSSRRRAFLVAGNLARVTHDVYGEAKNDKTVVTKTITGQPPTWNVTQDGTTITVNDQRIMTAASGDDTATIAAAIEKALAAKPAMLPKKEIEKLNKAWTKEHGYEATKEKDKAAEKNTDTKHADA